MFKNVDAGNRTADIQRQNGTPLPTGVLKGLSLVNQFVVSQTFADALFLPKVFYNLGNEVVVDDFSSIKEFI